MRCGGSLRCVASLRRGGGCVSGAGLRCGGSCVSGAGLRRGGSLRQGVTVCVVVLVCVHDASLRCVA